MNVVSNLRNFLLVLTFTVVGNALAANDCVPDYFEEGVTYSQPFGAELTIVEFDNDSCWVKIQNANGIAAWHPVSVLAGFIKKE